MEPEILIFFYHLKINHNYRVMYNMIINGEKSAIIYYDK